MNMRDIMKLVESANPSAHVLDMDGANEDEIIALLSNCDGKLRVEFDDKKNVFIVSAPHERGTHATVVVPYGAQSGDYGLRDVEEVKDWLYARYLTPEGR